MADRNIGTPFAATDDPEWLDLRRMVEQVVEDSTEYDQDGNIVDVVISTADWRRLADALREYRETRMKAISNRTVRQAAPAESKSTKPQD